MLSGSLTPCTATLLASSRHKSTSSTFDEYNALLPPSSAASEKSTPPSRNSISSGHSGSGIIANLLLQHQHSNASSSYSSTNNTANTNTSSDPHNGSTSSLHHVQQHPQQQQQHPQQQQHQLHLAAGSGSGNSSSGTAPSGATAPAHNTSAGRSAALERAYVHDVYEHCEEPHAGPVRPRVAQFLASLEPGSMVCDVGCGNGRYLNANPLCYTLGVERCARLAAGVRNSSGNSNAGDANNAGGGGGGGGGRNEVALCDNLELPFRDECFDAVLSVAVVHHFATTERRVGAIRELARVLRIGGRVIITVWALEQSKRRFESQDVLIPWQQPKSRNSNFSDEDDDDDFLPPYLAYTEDSTNSSRSAGDGDSSSLSSSSPGESCYSFVRRAIQKLAGSGRRHPWFLDNWTSKDTKNGSSLDYEDAKDLPIELRRLEDFDDFPTAGGALCNGGTSGNIGGGSGGGGCRRGNSTSSGGSNGSDSNAVVADSPLSAGLKSRSLGSILYPTPSASALTQSALLSRQIVRSRSSVPSLGSAIMPENLLVPHHQHHHCPNVSGPTSSSSATTASAFSIRDAILVSTTSVQSCAATPNASAERPTTTTTTPYPPDGVLRSGSPIQAAQTTRRPRLVKQKQSLCEDEPRPAAAADDSPGDDSATNKDTRTLLRKQSSLNEELMAESRIRERERVKRRIQKQTSLNETYLQSRPSTVLSRKFQVIRDGLTTKLKSGTGSLERVTKSSLVRIMQTVKSSTAAAAAAAGPATSSAQPNYYSPHYSAPTLEHGTTNGSGSSVPLAFGHIRMPWSLTRQASTPQTPPSSATALSCSSPMTTSTTSTTGSTSGSMDAGDGDPKERRHSRESGSDSSKDSLQSDTSIESEDSFASVIFIPKTGGDPAQQQPIPAQQLQPQQHPYHQHMASSNSNANSSSVDSPQFARTIPSMPTSPLVMPCPTPAHSPAPPRCAPPPPGSGAPHSYGGASETTRFPFENVPSSQQQRNDVFDPRANRQYSQPSRSGHHLSSGHSARRDDVFGARPPLPAAPKNPSPKGERITRHMVKNLPQIPKFRKHVSINYPIVRRANSTTPMVPKFASMELFNPATDDLDSDSSEPSSPDSIDSVISAYKPAPATANTTTTTSATTTSSEGSASDKGASTASITPEPSAVPALSTAAGAAAADFSHSNTLDVVPNKVAADSNEATAAQKITTISPNATAAFATDPEADSSSSQQPHQQHAHINRYELVAFAEQLSAQLLKEMDCNQRRAMQLHTRSEEFSEEEEFYQLLQPTHSHHRRRFSTTSSSSTSSSGTSGSTKQDDPYIRKLNGELKDLNLLREELRERRLMLANLNTAQYQNSSTIEEEDESPTRAEEEANNSQAKPADTPNASNGRDHNPFSSQTSSRQHQQQLQRPQQMSSIDAASSQDDIASMINSTDNLSVLAAEAVAMCPTMDVATSQQQQQQQPRQQQQQQQQPAAAAALESRPSVESWATSNSTASLDSPSAGGSSTHHRYYHVFREGELEALINHHVQSLHIVSSYYERASWCIVAEKVQVWSI